MLVRSTAVPRKIRTSPFAENIFQDICGVCRVDHRYQGVSASLDSVITIVTVGITAHGNGFSFHTEHAQSCCRSCGRGSTVPASPNALFDRRHLSSTPYPEEAIKNMMPEKKIIAPKTQQHLISMKCVICRVDVVYHIHQALRRSPFLWV